MPITIGAKKESDFTDPVGMLGDCHRRIERFLSVLEKLAAEQHGAELTQDERRALSASLTYFREAAPKHTADEEESLFPRMRSADPVAAHELFARIDSLEGDHQAATRLHDSVDALGETWLSRGTLLPAEASHLATLVAALAALYQRHIAVEDTEIFPAARNLLSPSDSQAIGVEMAARRGLGPSPVSAPATLPT